MADDLWQVASDDNGKRKWFITRHNPQGDEVALDGRGYFRRFGTQKAAQAVADKMNGIVPERGVSATITKTASRYLARMQRGERILRDATGRLQWADGRNVGGKTVRLMLEAGIIRPLDTDLFGDYSRGQTIGLGA